MPFPVAAVHRMAVGVAIPLEAARFRFWALLSVWGSCHEDSSGCEIAGVGEPVSNAA